MQCPSCSSYNLKPTKLDAGLAARVCGRCSGIFLSMLSYRTWLESNPVITNNEKVTGITAIDNERALGCPSCSRLMLKFKFNTEANKSNHLDVCTHCENVWLDFGEWQLLKLLELHKELGLMMTDHWQYEHMKEQEQDNFEERYEKLLGSEDYEQLIKTKDWLNSNPNKREIIHYLLKQKQKLLN